MSKKNKSSKKSVKTVKTTKGTVGAPEKEMKFPRGKFTTSDVKALNPKTATGGVCGLTVINRIEKLVKAGQLIQLKETRKAAKAGRPSFLFMTSAMYEAAQARKKAKTESVATVETTPVVESVPVEVISPAPVNVDETQATNTEAPVETPVAEVPTIPVVETAPEAAVIGGEPVAA